MPSARSVAASSNPACPSRRARQVRVGESSGPPRQRVDREDVALPSSDGWRRPIPRRPAVAEPGLATSAPIDALARSAMPVDRTTHMSQIQTTHRPGLAAARGSRARRVYTMSTPRCAVLTARLCTTLRSPRSMSSASTSSMRSARRSQKVTHRPLASPDRRHTPDGIFSPPAHLAKIARELALQSEHTSTKSDAAAPATVAVRGKRRHVEPAAPSSHSPEGCRSLAVSPDRRDHADRRCDGASDDEGSDPGRSTVRAGGLFTSEAGKQQDEPREGCECDSSERSIRRGCNPPRIASSLRHAKSR